MKEGTILEILDVFQIEGKGTVVTGYTKEAWDTAKIGDQIILRTPHGQTLATSINGIELFLKGRLDRSAPLWGGILLANPFRADQLPRGTCIVQA